MAISARSAQLMNQRNPYGKLRILSPVNSSIDNISRQNSQMELKTMIERYNDGQVGNDEMSAFLNRIYNAPGLTVSERVNVQDQIRDFDVRIRGEKLEAAFKAAPELSFEKEKAAQALASFYKERAASMSPDTPAQSQALQNAVTWENQAISIKDSAEKLARKNFRYLAEQKINQNPTGSQKSLETSQMYSQLAQQAANDGDMTEANRLQALAVQYDTQAQQYAQKEQEDLTKGDRNTQIENINYALNAYHDGNISSEQVFQVLQAADQWALANNDTSLMMKVNTLSDQIAKGVIKGGLNRSTMNGMPVVLKGSAGGSGSQTTSWDVEDKNYSDNIRLTQEMLKSGKWDVNKYNEAMGKILTTRQEQIDTRVNTLEAIAETNPNDKYYYAGKKQRVADLLERVYAEQEQLDPQVQAFQNGTATVIEIPPDKKMGKNTVSYQLIDANSIPPEERDQYVSDESGVLHKVMRDQIAVTPDLQKNIFNGYYTDPTTLESQPVRYDSSGNAYIFGSQKVRVYDTDTQNYVDQPYVKGQNVQSFNEYDRMQKEAVQTAEKQKTEELKSGLTPKMIPPVVNDQPQMTINKDTLMPGLTNKQPVQIKQEPLVQIQKAAESVAPMVQKGVEAVQAQIPKVEQFIQPKIEAIQSLPVIKQAAQILNPPTVSAPSTPKSGGSYAPTINVNNQTMVKQYDPNKGITYQPIQAPKPPEPKQNLLQNIGTTLSKLKWW